MAVEPSERYATVRALQQDLERYLADEPVVACQEPWIDRGLRTVRKRRWLLPAVAVGVIGLFAANAMLDSIERRNQSRLTAAAEEKERAVREAFDLTADAFGVIDPFGKNQDNVERLEEAAREIEKLDISEDVKADVYDVIVSVLKRFQRPDSATRWAEESLRISRASLGPQAPKSLQRQRRLAQVYEIDGEYERAKELLQDLVERTQTEGGDQYFDYLHDLSAVNYELGNVEDSLRLERGVIAHARAGFRSLIQRSHPCQAQSGHHAFQGRSS